MQIISTIPLHCWSVFTEDTEYIRIGHDKWLKVCGQVWTPLTLQEYQPLEDMWIDGMWGGEPIPETDNLIPHWSPTPHKRKKR
jgi:hypothetical protein